MGKLSKAMGASWSIVSVASSAAMVLVLSPMGVAAAAPPVHRALPPGTRTPTQMHLAPRTGRVTTFTVQQGNTCYYFPPSFYDPGSPSGSSDDAGGPDPSSGDPNAIAGSYFDLFGTGGTQDTFFLGGSDQGSVDQQVGEWVAPQDFLSGSTVTVFNPWSYDGVLKVDNTISPLDVLGGTSSGTASMNLSVVFENNGLRSSTAVANRSIHTSTVSGSTEVFGSGTKNITTSIVPNTTQIGIFDGIDLNLEGDDSGPALSNVDAFAVFEGTSSNTGNQLGAFDGANEVWAYSLPPNDFISSC